MNKLILFISNIPSLFHIKNVFFFFFKKKKIIIIIILLYYNYYNYYLIINIIITIIKMILDLFYFIFIKYKAT